MLAATEIEISLAQEGGVQIQGHGGSSTRGGGSDTSVKSREKIYASRLRALPRRVVAWVHDLRRVDARQRRGHDLPLRPESDPLLVRDGEQDREVPEAGPNPPHSRTESIFRKKRSRVTPV